MREKFHIEKVQNFPLLPTLTGVTLIVVTIFVYAMSYRENMARGGGICVANHTSPVDIIILGCDNCYAMVSQLVGLCELYSRTVITAMLW